MRPMFRRSLASLAATTALTLAAGLGAAPAQAFSTAASGVRLDAVEARLAYLINHARTTRGLPALTVAPGTTDLARNWSMNQARSNRLYHNPDLVAGIEAHGSKSWYTVAENVGRGWTADSLFNAYMSSPAHRANILDRAMRYLGIGWVELPDGSGYNTQVFVDHYSGTYGRNRVPAVGGLADVRTPTSSTTVASFENGWDPRVLLRNVGSGLTVTGPYFDGATSGDDGAVFTVRQRVAGTGAYAELRLRDALDLRHATGLRVRVSATTGTGLPVILRVFARRELGTSVPLGRIVVVPGHVTTVTLPVPSAARNFRNMLGFAITSSALDGVSGALSGRTTTLRVRDVAVLV